MDPEVTVTSEMSLGREGPAGDSPSLSARTGGLASFLNSIRFAFGPRAAALMGASMLGLAVPLAAGQMTGHPAEGMAASLGGLALGGAASGGTFGDRAKTLVYDLIAGCLGMLIGSSLARYGIVAVGPSGRGRPGRVVRRDQPALGPGEYPVSRVHGHRHEHRDFGPGNPLV